ncbi:hypothetical protein D9611_012951 [Ephemerocybe angulata]|uniref:Uncharacterized protein n=1 Tax=Ephemerocybe angulata TaxID=980116 RepID=A0A8H5FF21_9AGAR|nr:hypothetical protein D9611_012951 [Tulosesus angulatus]
MATSYSSPSTSPSSQPTRRRVRYFVLNHQPSMSSIRPPIRQSTAPATLSWPQPERQGHRPSYPIPGPSRQASVEVPPHAAFHQAHLYQEDEHDYASLPPVQRSQGRSSRMPPFLVHDHLEFYDEECEESVIKALPDTFYFPGEGSIENCKRCVATACFNLDARAETERDDTLAVLVGRLRLVQEMWDEYERRKKDLREFILRMDTHTQELDRALEMESGREDVAAEVVALMGENLLIRFREVVRNWLGWSFEDSCLPKRLVQGHLPARIGFAAETDRSLPRLLIDFRFTKGGRPTQSLLPSTHLDASLLAVPIPADPNEQLSSSSSSAQELHDSRTTEWASGQFKAAGTTKLRLHHSGLASLRASSQSHPLQSPQRPGSRPPPYSLHGHLDFYDQQCEDAVINVLPNAYETSGEGSIQKCRRCIETARFNLDARAEAERDDSLATLVGRVCLVQEMWSEYERKKAELHEFVLKMEAQTRMLGQALEMESGREEIAAEVLVLKGQIDIRRVPQNLVRELVQVISNLNARVQTDRDFALVLLLGSFHSLEDMWAEYDERREQLRQGLAPDVAKCAVNDHGGSM